MKSKESNDINVERLRRLNRFRFSSTTKIKKWESSNCCEEIFVPKEILLSHEPFSINEHKIIKRISTDDYEIYFKKSRNNVGRLNRHEAEDYSDDSVSESCQSDFDGEDVTYVYSSKGKQEKKSKKGLKSLGTILKEKKYAVKLKQALKFKLFEKISKYYFKLFKLNPQHKLLIEARPELLKLATSKAKRDLYFAMLRGDKNELVRALSFCHQYPDLKKLKEYENAKKFYTSM